MPIKLTKNTFEGGLNIDLDQSKLNPNQYTSARNVELSTYSTTTVFAEPNPQGGNNQALKVRPIKGSYLIKDLPAGTIDHNMRVLAVAKSKYDDQGTTVEGCLTIFTLDSTGVFTIMVYLPTGGGYTSGTLRTLYTSTADADFKASNNVVDYDIFHNEDYDTIYFNDGYHELRKLDCIIPSPFVASYLTDADLILERDYPLALVSLSSVGTAGSLLCGSYNYSIRLYDEDTGKFTKWSSLTNPVYTFSVDGTSARSSGGIGTPTDCSVNLSITLEGGHETAYSHYQIGVVENVTSIKTDTLSLLPLTVIPSASFTFTHSSSDYVELRSVSEVIVNKSPIKSAKTVAIKDNRMFHGNVEYYDLSYDNVSGSPTITTGSVITRSSTAVRDDQFADAGAASKDRGYFRGEVYRYYITYFDGYGNYSNPKPLDLSGVTDNQISGVLTDMKFPDQTIHTDWSLLDTSDRVKSLGLSLTIDNHPTWARGFEILRAKRKKNILFQTPLVPMAKIDGVIATGSYPSSASESSGTVAYADAQPMNPLGTYVPKNFFRVYNAGFDSFGTGNDDLYHSVEPSPNYYQIFPPQNIYDSSDVIPRWQFSKANANIVDAAALRLSYDVHDATGTYNEGDWIGTSVSGTFYAISNGFYYYNEGAGAKVTAGDIGDSLLVTDARYFDNYDNGQVIGTDYLLEYSNLETDTIQWGTKAEAPRSAVIRVQQGGTGSTIVSETTAMGITFSGGNINATIKTDYNTGGSYSDVNDFVFEHASYLSADPVSVVYIANVVAGLQDSRYGDEQAQHEVIPTGTKYVFDNTELTTVEAGTTLPIAVEVFGGDCYVTLHNYKISDTLYSLTNSDSADAIADVVAKWDRGFLADDGTTPLRMPVPLKNCDQILSIVLESEINSDVLEQQVGDSYVSSTNLKYSLNTVEGNARLYPTYKYNPNLSNENDYKVYTPFREPDFSVTSVPNRIHYSNIHIFGNTESGFETYNVLDYYDLNGNLGAITKLINFNNNLYSVNKDAIVYLPVGERLLETADADILQVRSGEVIGNPFTITNRYGSTLLKSIVALNDGFIIVDNSRQCVLKVMGNEFDVISKYGVQNHIRSTLPTNTLPYEFTTIYDSVRNIVILANRAGTTANALVFNNNLGLWETFLEHDTSEADSEVIIMDGLTVNLGTKHGLGCIGLSGDGAANFNLEFHELFSDLGAFTLFGKAYTPTLTFSVNQEPDLVKTYDNVFVYSTGDLSSVAVYPNLYVDPISTTTPNAAALREGIYKLQVLRGSTGFRARGSLALISLNFGQNDSAVSQVITKYRHSPRAY